MADNSQVGSPSSFDEENQNTASSLLFQRAEPSSIHNPHEPSPTTPSPTSHASSVPSTAVAELLEVAHKASNNNQLFPHSDEYDDLSSLQVPKVPAMPDELDRKRFLGCLASILAARYDYDVPDEPASTVDDININNNDYYEEYLEDSNSNSEHGVRPSGRSDSFNTTSNNNHCTNSPTRHRRRKHLLQQAQEKHRQRRYHFYCDLLSNAALYLDLDPNHSKCFLPMLSTLLHPSNTNSTTTTTTETNNNDNDDDNNYNIYAQHIQNIDHLESFLTDLTVGSGVQCLTMFLTQLLLHSVHGYDARVRVVLRQLGVLVLWHDDPRLTTTQASRKFEQFEQAVAAQLIALSLAQQELESQPNSAGFHRKTKRTNRDKWIRGLKIGGTAVAAGTLFAITGGLAAPGIAAGVAALAGTTAVAAVLTSTAAVTTIFGVGGGGLVAYKMNRRVVGLTEFTFVPESKSSHPLAAHLSTDLFSTICISGWIRDDCDYQRPWGVDPSRPPIVDRLELLERFYSVYRPGHIPKCKQILQSWKDEESQLWQLLHDNYGTDPSHLFPLEDRPRDLGKLTLCETERIDELFVKMGCVVPGHKSSTRQQQQQPETPLQRLSFDPQDNLPRTTRSELRKLDSLDSAVTESMRLNTQESSSSSSDESSVDHPKHLATVWDYQGTYGGEQYTVRWESQLLEELYDSVADLAADVLTGATAHMLKYTALSALASAVALPVALITAASMLDGTWTLAAERADEAGKELAKSLIFSSAGNRPVTLVGYSFGARVIYSCLKELSRLQVLWEEHRDSPPPRGRRGNKFDEQNPEYFAKMREPASIVGDAILMGLPNHLSLSSWKAARQVVAGRLVHCFSQRDMILMLMFQIKKFGLKSVCGTVPVNVSGVENVDVTDIVQGHHQHYCMFAGEILKRVRHGEPFQADATGVVLDVETAVEEK